MKNYIRLTLSMKRVPRDGSRRDKSFIRRSMTSQELLRRSEMMALRMAKSASSIRINSDLQTTALRYLARR